MNCPLIEKLNINISTADAYGLFQNDLNSAFLDSGMDPEKLGRYSFIGIDPFMAMKSRGDEITIVENGDIRKFHSNPFDMLHEILGRYKTEMPDFDIPFTGGAIGYLSYDLCHFIEKLPSKAVDDQQLPESYFCFYDTAIAFDNLKSEAYIISSGFPEMEESRRLQRAGERIAQVKRQLSLYSIRDTKPIINHAPVADTAIKSNFTREGYIDAVEKVRRYIREGDVFQVNLSQRFETELEIPPYELYLRLRNINPAPFAAYLNFDGVTVVCASPERFLKLNGDRVETRPIKGTRPRGKDSVEDNALAQELLNSAKDRAENIMIVDLERNDLGRVCSYGSVKVKELAILETFPTVFHLTSTVTGRLRENKKLVDLLKASFPGGSITGAPKVRAMEIIDELEPTRRSIYTGAIGYMSFSGDMDLNIVIRTLIIKGRKVYFQAGGGIIYDSNAEEEYLETFHKAKALMDALQSSPATVKEKL